MAAWSEVQFTELTGDLRLDAEYYHPEFLAQADIITSLPHMQLSPDIASVSDGNHLAIRERFVPEGIRYLRGQDLNDLFISDSDPIFIPEEEYKSLARSHMHPGDVLLGIVGTIGSVGLVTDRFDKLTGNCKLAIIRPKEIQAEYMAAFLASKLGQNEITRRIRGTVQKGLILPDLRQIPVPLLSPSARQTICNLVIRSHQKRAESQRLYEEAQNLLLSELGLDSLDLSPALSYERPYSEAVATHRLDAEYFQPKYYRLERAIKRCKYGARPLGNLIEPIRNGFDFREFGSGTTPYIRVGDIANGLINLDSAERIPLALESIKKNVKLQLGDLLFTRKGTYGSVAVVRPGQKKAVISSEIMLLRLIDKDILPDYLAIYLNSPLGYYQVERRVHGVAFYSISQPSLAQIAVVHAPRPLQEKIRRLVQDSYSAVLESKELLEGAKRKVEEAVRRGGS